MNKYFYCITISFVVLSCQLKNDNSVSMNHREQPDWELEKLVIEQGDTSAYYNLSVAYLDYSSEKFLPYALIMANKYDYPQAYFDVFTCLTDIYIENINQIDTTTANLAINYLLKADQRQHHQAKDIVEKYSIKYKEGMNKTQIIKMFE